MEEILEVIAEVEHKAVKIIQLAEDEKERLRKEALELRDKFEHTKQEEYETKLSSYKAKLDIELEEALRGLEKQLTENQIEIKEYYKNNEDQMVKTLIKQVIGE